VPVKTPTQPHQGKENLFKESLHPDLDPLKPLTINGRTTERIKRVYAVKAIHENGLWLIYSVLEEIQNIFQGDTRQVLFL